MSTFKTAAEAPCITASRPWSFSQEVAANVGRWEPETRINSLQTAVSARRLGVNGGKEGPGGTKAGYGHPPGTVEPASGHMLANR